MSIILYISEILMPLIMILIIILGLFKGVEVYDAFVEGACDGAKTVFNVLPSLIGLMCGVSILRISGFLDILVNIINPLASIIGLPSEALPIAIMRLVSSSAATGMVLDIFKTLGPDSFAGRLVSVMMGCTETVFYTMSVYFLSVGITKTRYTLSGAILSNIVGILVSLIICRILW